MKVAIKYLSKAMPGFLVLLICLVYSPKGFGQVTIDSILGKIDPQKYASVVSQKANKLADRVRHTMGKAILKMERAERKLYEKLLKGKDSLLALQKLKELNDRYNAIKSGEYNTALNTTTRHYIPTLDSLNTSLKFLDQNSVSAKVRDALSKTELLQLKFDQAEQLKKIIKERKELLKQQFEKLGLVKQLKKINKTIYYYSAQLHEYKSILNDPKKIEKKALELLGKTKVFREFMRKNSLLASLFRLPGDPNDPANQASLAGLQTRASVNNLIQQQIASGGPNAQQQFQQNMQAAQSQLNELKDKLFKTGTGSGDAEIPDFKPNNQKTKSFLKRLEYGTNIQTQKATNFFPTTSDIGLSLGYKINDKSVIGIGSSYKIGLGRGWNNFRVSHQGVSIRSYMDIKLKGSFWISGGYEQNYKSAFHDFDQLRNSNAWQQSGLIGISKVISMKSKLFKKTKLQLLWDFLSYQQIPVSQPVIFRIGYNIK